MTEKTYFTGIAIIFAFGAVVRGAVTILSNGSIDPQPAVEYRAVCSNLPANAHRNGSGGKDDGTRKEIPQTQGSQNVRGPSPVGEYDAVGTGSDAGCYFICDNEYDRDNSSRCRATCETGYFEIGSYKIAKCNVGAQTAGTGEDSYGRHFQRGNNYGFRNGITGQTDMMQNGSITVQEGQVSTTGYNRQTPYVDSTFRYLSRSGDRSNPSNDDLRGDVTNTKIARQGPCASGYHVPTIAERTGIVASSGRNGAEMSNELLLPMAGYRHYTGNVIVNIGYYWSSNTGLANSQPSAYALKFGVNPIDDSEAQYRADGKFVRCFKNS